MFATLTLMAGCLGRGGGGLAQVLGLVTERAQICEIDGRELGGMQLGSLRAVLLEVLVCSHRPGIWGLCWCIYFFACTWTPQIQLKSGCLPKVLFCMGSLRVEGTVKLCCGFQGKP